MLRRGMVAPRSIWGLTLVALLACGDDDTTPPPMDAGEPDAGEVDAGPPPMSTLFGECVVDEQCPGAGAFCRLNIDGHPKGSCTVPCEDRSPCDDGVVFHRCDPDPNDRSRNICQEKCLNSQDCSRAGFVCIGSTGFAGEEGICIGYCTTDEDCGEGAVCNVHSARCVHPDEYNDTLSATGEPCYLDDDCQSGECRFDNDGGPTGFNGGYCLGACILPAGYNTNTFFAEDAYPTEQCPGDNVCYPPGSLARGSAGVCLKACTTDDDCRAAEGYTCDKTVSLANGTTKTFENGFCWPINCAVDDCPTGYSCQTVGSGDRRRSVCTSDS